MPQFDAAGVCIIGGGVAASLMATRLARHGIDVLILEAGPRHDPAKRFEYMRKSLYGEDPWKGDKPERDLFTLDGQMRAYDLNERRVKGVGGSGLHWGGMAARLHESDFELYRRYQMGVDWPISYRDLEPYYTMAEEMIGVAGSEAPPWTPWRSRPYPLPPFPFSYSDRLLKPAFDRLNIPLHHTSVARTSVAYGGRPPCLSYAMCQACPIFAKWTPDLLLSQAEQTGNVTVRPETRVVRINPDSTGRTIESVTAVSLVNGSPVQTEFRAPIMVLAAHGVESARLLLRSTSPSHPDGLGNNSGYVGKYFMEHPFVGGLGELPERTYVERIGFETAQSHYLYETAREQGGTAFILLLGNRQIQSPLDIVNEELSRRLIWGDELKAVVQQRFGFGASIGALLEQLPYEANRVSLDTEIRDDLGLPVPKLAYFLDQPRELRTMKAASAVIRKLFAALGVTDIKMRSGLAPGHHMGMCRMGDDPRSSVVDRQLNVHGVQNLYVVGSSVFPTSGAGWPTLTVAALALRLADELRSRL
jgi:choline dehydrogenase-like flavoprotein